ncbi:MAG: sn-glycerol-3-phosphate ABC transporter ATP-binding protein UgpC [Oscillospiraceae bacterium]|nr:sn-glycerol-3-phosphate ABC transporter ATP-binding protein UgpC [Oscillospiraceae bacterium]
MASITLKNVFKIYPDGFTAVNDLSLEIRDREFVVLVGPSGCGKSTTLRMIAGLEEISKGELYIGDRLVNSIAPKDRDIAMVFQSYALYPDKTVYKNISFGLERRKTPKDEIQKRVMQAAKILDIEHLLNRKPRALSGGQRQRVALGRAIVRSPSVFLFDEPLSNLDAKLRTAMRSEITKLHKNLDATFIYVTHDQTEAMTMGDRIVVMRDGVVQQVAKPQELYDAPRNMFVAGFIGSPQMNFIDAVLRNKNGRVFAAVKDDAVLLPENEKFKTLPDGKKLKLGIRPENIVTEKERFAPDEPVLHGRVDICELMGSEVFLYIDCKGTRLTVRAPSYSAPKADEELFFQFDRNKLHLFDAETEEVIR